MTPKALELYRHPVDEDDLNERIKQHAPLVKRLAYHLVARLPASVEVDDLIQAGMIGLMDAAQHFDDAAGVLFETYASQRIRGAMLDELRTADWVPRQVRRSMRELENTLTKLEHTLGRSPSEREMAEAMGMALDEYQQLLSDCKGHQLLYYDDRGEDEDSPHLLDALVSEDEGPLEILSNVDFHKALVSAIETLPEREQLVMALHYDEELNLKEIGAVLNVSESRVCQLHSQAVARLRTRLGEWVRSRDLPVRG
ncbi:RNA polymerase sigma factor FliA [Burkholderiaceae bacterium DAT-1]|nr:RNA polymerase sigma factor FliA [Burkholderiaceae bacterium DAT-1]